MLTDGMLLANGIKVCVKLSIRVHEVFSITGVKEIQFNYIFAIACSHFLLSYQSL